VTRVIVGSQSLGRLPFRRRPVAEPGTTLVFQLASGEIVAPSHPYTTGDVWWRRAQKVYIVDARSHAEAFRCTTPCAGDAVHFDASVSFAWSVWQAAAVVREQVDDAAAQCSGYLTQRMRQITRRFAAEQSAEAEQAVQLELGAGPINLDRGLRITGFTVALALDAEQAQLAKTITMAPLQHRIDKAKKKSSLKIDKMGQKAELARHKERAHFYTELLSAGPASMAANMLAQDPTRAAEAANFMVALAQQDQDLAIRAMKVLVESDQIRIGEIDPAVAAVVERFTALVSEAGGKLASGALPAPAPDRQLPSATAPTGEEPAPEAGRDQS